MPTFPVLDAGKLAADNDSDRPVLLELTIGEAFDRAVARHADRTALVVAHQQVRWTYAQLADQVSAAAAGLLTLGLHPGDRLGIWSPNRAEWTVTQYAAAKLGLVLVNINPAYRVAELEYALVKSECRALVLADTFKGANYPEMLQAIAPELASSAPGALRAQRLPHLSAAIQIGGRPTAGLFGFDEILERGRAAGGSVLDAVGARLSNGDPINIQFTSGTTGSPKGATLTHRNLLNNAYLTGRLLRITEADTICVPMPLFHVFGMGSGNLLAMLSGAAVVHPSEAFDVEAVLSAIEREQCTALYGVPTMFIAELAHPSFAERDLSSLRTGILAGAPVPMALMRQARGPSLPPRRLHCAPPVP